MAIVAGLSVKERAELQALLEEVNVKPGHGESELQPHNSKRAPVSASDLIGLRERLHFDAACGSEAWQVELASCTPNYIEQDERDALWSAHMSAIVRLRWGSSVHEDTGTGLGVHSSRQMAEQLAAELCLVDGAKRLAKRFACSLSVPVQHSIALQVQQQQRQQHQSK